ncbi:hypothetical protein G6F57_022733 [Rhizopus arrhizus]|nr:hypothetical protein G6F57_022733 [Rhizopus arrhizus]
MARIDEELKPLKLKYDLTKGRLDEIRDLKQKLDELKSKAIQARNNYDLDTAADIEYYAIPDVEQRIAELQAEKQRKMSEDLANDQPSRLPMDWNPRSKFGQERTREATDDGN